jgi:ABC-type amino acid transport system permease subunit
MAGEGVHMTLKLKIVLTFFAVVGVLFLAVWQRKRFPKPVEEALDALRIWWLGVAKKIGHVQTVVILFIFYYTAIAITALISRCLRHDHLKLHGSAGWHRRKKKKDTIATLLRQF